MIPSLSAVSVMPLSGDCGRGVLTESIVFIESNMLKSLRVGIGC